MKKTFIWISVYILPPILLGVVWLIVHALYPEWLEETWAAFLVATGVTGGSLASYYYKRAKLIYNWLLDKFYYDLSILPNKKGLESAKIKVFWVDDEFMSTEEALDAARVVLSKNGTLHAAQVVLSENGDLDAARRVLSGIYNSVVVTPSVPANDAELNNYHILIFDVDGVSQEGNRYDALGIATSLYNENPYRVFLICSGRYSCPLALLDVCRGKFIRKGENITNNVQYYGGILSKPKAFWEEKVEPYLRRKGLDDKSVEEIKIAYIKDWKKKCEDPDVEVKTLKMYALLKKEKYRDINLLDLCNFVLL